MCGREGCVERYASARGLVLSFLEASGTCDDAAQFCDIAPKDATDALSVYRAAKQGDPRGQRAFAIMADKLGFALAQMACVVDPDVILLGGGLTAAADLYLDALREAYRAYAFGACKVTEIRLSTLLGNAGVIGSARYAMQTAASGRPARG